MKTLPDNPLRLDPEFDGYCLCASFEFDGCRFETHCWRSGCCKYSCVHYSPTNENVRSYAKEISSFISEAYMTEVSIQEL